MPLHNPAREGEGEIESAWETEIERGVMREELRKEDFRVLRILEERERGEIG